MKIHDEMSKTPLGRWRWGRTKMFIDGRVNAGRVQREPTEKLQAEKRHKGGRSQTGRVV